MKLNSTFDSQEYDQHLLKRLFELSLMHKELLVHQFTSEQLQGFKRVIDWLDETYITEYFEQAEDILKIVEYRELGSLTNKELEKKAADIKISEITVEDIWQVAIDALKEAGTKVIQNNSGRSR